jgi:pimeloyl-ACP methyl ester carboxylesterase
LPIAHVNGVDLAYEEYGEGFPLILVHEFAGSMESWLPQLNFFSRRYRVIVYNARGYPPRPSRLTLLHTARTMPSRTSMDCSGTSASSRRTSAAFLWAAPARCISVSDTRRWRAR